MAITKPLLEKWFGLFDSTLRAHNITSANLWNMDGIGFQMGMLGKSHIVIP